MKSFIEFIRHISGELKDIPMVTYSNGNYSTFLNGEEKKVKIPEAILGLIENNVNYKVFKQSDKYVHIFVISVNVDELNYKIAIKDEDNYGSILKLFSLLFAFGYEKDFSETSLIKEVDLLREELDECERELTDLYEKYNKLEEEIEKKNFEIEGLEESVNVLRKSRHKMLKLIDGLNIPLFSVDENYELLNINRAVANFTGEKDYPKFIGSKCYKLIYNNEQICKWCKFEDIKESKETFCQHIEIDKNDKKFVYELTMYPIFDDNDNVVEVGEYLSDITEQYNLIENLKKSKEQIFQISKERIEGINEISSLKAEYKKLLQVYEESQGKIKKLSSALQKMLEQNTINELLKLKSENKELKHKIGRLENSVDNYKKLLSEEHNKIGESIKKSAYSIERLINMVDKKKKIEDKDLENIFNFLTNEIKMLKEYINKEELNGDKGGN